MQLLQAASPYGSWTLFNGFTDDNFYNQIFKYFEMFFALKWTEELFSAVQSKRLVFRVLEGFLYQLSLQAELSFDRRDLLNLEIPFVN